jgi:putative protease
MAKPKKRAASRKAPAPRRRPPSRPAAKAAVAQSRITPEQQIVGAVYLGKVMNYFSHLGVISITLEAPLAAGDMIRIKGHTTDLTQKVDTIQVNHQNVQSAGAGEAVGLKVADKTRPGDAVYKV